jgi:hypothetical protein
MIVKQSTYLVEEWRQSIGYRPSVHSVPVAVDLAGRLDATALTESLRRLALRHESLRCTFDPAGGQVLREPRTPQLQTVRTPDAAAVDALVTDLAAEPVDVGAGPLWRATLAKCATDHHVLALAFHHLIWDGASEAVLLHELRRLYGQVLGTPQAALPTAPQTAEFAQLERRVTVPDLQWWTDRLTIRQPNWSADLWQEPRPRELLAVPFRLTARAPVSIPRIEGTSPGDVVRAAAAAALQPVLHDASTVLGVVSSRRDVPNARGIIGMLAEQMPVRVDVSGTLRDVTLGAHAAIRDARRRWQGVTAPILRHVAAHSGLRVPQVMHAAVNMFPLVADRTPARHATGVAFSSRPVPVAAITPVFDRACSATLPLAFQVRVSRDRTAVIGGEIRGWHPTFGHNDLSALADTFLAALGLMGSAPTTRVHKI